MDHLGRMVDDPVVLLLIPFSLLFVLAVFFGRHEVVDDDVLQFELVGQLLYSVEHVVSLSIKVLLA